MPLHEIIIHIVNATPYAKFVLMLIVGIIGFLMITGWNKD
jgi:hypothetical protein